MHILLASSAPRRVNAIVEHDNDTAGFLVGRRTASSSCANAADVVACATQNSMLLSDLLIVEIEEATKEFLLLAYTKSRKASLGHLMQEITSDMQDLRYGNEPDVAAPPAGSEIEANIGELLSGWNGYRTFLQDNIDTLRKDSEQTLITVSDTSNTLLLQAKMVQQMLRGYASSRAISTSKRDTSAREQVYHLHTIAKHALFMDLKIDASKNMENLQAHRSGFIVGKENLIYGNPNVGIPETNEVCILKDMFLVSKEWEEIKQTISTIESTGTTETLVLSLDETVSSAVSAMKKVIKRIDHDDEVCEAKYDEKTWEKLVSATKNFVLMLQTSGRFYLDIASGLRVDDTKVFLQESLANADDFVKQCRKGSAYKSVVPPPTQALADKYQSMMGDWNHFDADVRSFVYRGDFSEKALNQVAKYSRKVEAKMAEITFETIQFALDAGATLKIVSSETALNQLALAEQISKEALLVRLGASRDKNYGYLVSSLDSFERNHNSLLKGRASTTPSTRMENLQLLQADNYCVLNRMMYVIAGFASFRAHVIQVNETIPSSNGTQDYADEIGKERDHVMSTMTQAIESFDGVECKVDKTKEMWESGLNLVAQMPFVVEKSVSNFYLVASKLSQLWLDASADTLENHRGFILQEARTDLVIEAIESFSNAWTLFRETDEERVTSLQVAYVTLNPHPTGEKDKLDAADGEEEYHKVHQKFHPLYRDTLYKRDYYDIFMFDLQGNLIYSVYKELDYATNFAANGTGPWKTSGLGDAFDAAIKNPDNITVIDWRPYGPSAGAPASFLATGVRNHKGKVIGVFSTQLPPSSIPLDAGKQMKAAMSEGSEILEKSKFGQFGAIYPPPSQETANKLLTASGSWDSLSDIISEPATEALAKEATRELSAISSANTAMVNAYVEKTFEEAPSLETGKILLSWDQVRLAQFLCRQTVGLRMSLSTREEIGKTVAQYDAKKSVLISGNTQGQDRKNGFDASPTVDRRALNKIDSAADEWAPLKKLVTSIADGAETDEKTIRAVVDATATLVNSLSDVATWFGWTTRTTTMIQVEILAPMPLTGAWAAGRTMRVAALLAESIINSDQKILPGMELRTVFFDDKCSGSTSSQTILAEMATKDTYIGLGGGGCDEVCKTSATTAKTIKLPFVSYDCTAKELSKAETYEGFSRFGTVTNSATDKIIKALRSRFSWKRIDIISEKGGLYVSEAEERVTSFQLNGIATDSYSAAQDDWDEIVSEMTRLKQNSLGNDRAVFFVGSESMYRKVVCASIVAEHRKGLTWLSEGTWRDSWWKSTDSMTDFNIQWLLEDTATPELRQTFAAFKAGWDSFRPTVDETREKLIEMYHTPELEKLVVPADAGDEEYHKAHETWHTLWRRTLFDRNYYDIFVFDLNGDMIYSVYKESDYGTNFAKNGNGPWKTSGLGDAFEQALANPREVHFIDWKPYGPSGDKPAAFFSTGLEDENENLVGVYAIQLPPTFEKSIELRIPECSLEAISDSFEGAINIAGLGKPTQENVEKPLPCFDSHSYVSFSKLLDYHYENGFPKGDRKTMVSAPYDEIKTAAADGTCVFAFTVRKLLDEGHTIQDIQVPTDELYNRFVAIIREELDFQGVSGRVNFNGNDRPNFVGIKQVIGGEAVDVGLVSVEGEIEWFDEYPVNTSWTKEFPKPKAYFPYEVIQVLVPATLILFPMLMGMSRGFLSSRS